MVKNFVGRHVVNLDFEKEDFSNHFKLVPFEGHAKQGNSFPASAIKSITFLVVCSSSPKALHVS
jgi:hypothetical protein